MGYTLDMFKKSHFLLLLLLSCLCHSKVFGQASSYDRAMGEVNSTHQSVLEPSLKINPYLVRVEKTLGDQKLVGTGYIFKWNEDYFIRTAPHIFRGEIQGVKFYQNDQEINVSKSDYLIDNDKDDAIFKISDSTNKYNTLGTLAFLPDGNPYIFGEKEDLKKIISQNESGTYCFTKSEPLFYFSYSYKEMKESVSSQHYCLRDYFSKFYTRKAFNELYYTPENNFNVNRGHSRPIKNLFHILGDQYGYQIKLSQSGQFYISEHIIKRGNSGSPLLSSSLLLGLTDEGHKILADETKIPEIANKYFIVGHASSKRFYFDWSYFLSYTTFSNLIELYSSGLRAFTSETTWDQQNPWNLRHNKKVKAFESQKQVQLTGGEESLSLGGGEAGDGGQSVSQSQDESIKESVFRNTKIRPGLVVDGMEYLAFVISTPRKEVTRRNYTLWKDYAKKDRTYNYYQAPEEKIKKRDSKSTTMIYDEAHAIPANWNSYMYFQSLKNKAPQEKKHLFYMIPFSFDGFVKLIRLKLKKFKEHFNESHFVNKSNCTIQIDFDKVVIDYQFYYSKKNILEFESKMSEQNRVIIDRESFLSSFYDNKLVKLSILNEYYLNLQGLYSTSATHFSGRSAESHRYEALAKEKYKKLVDTDEYTHGISVTTETYSDFTFYSSVPFLQISSQRFLGDKVSWSPLFCLEK